MRDWRGLGWRGRWNAHERSGSARFILVQCDRVVGVQQVSDEAVCSFLHARQLIFVTNRAGSFGGNVPGRWVSGDVPRGCRAAKEAYRNDSEDRMTIDVVSSVTLARCENSVGFDSFVCSFPDWHDLCHVMQPMHLKK